MYSVFGKKGDKVFNWIHRRNIHFFFNRVFVIIPKWDLLHELLQSSNQVATDLFNQAGPSYSEDRNPDGVWSNKLATSLLQVCYNLYEIRRAAGPLAHIFLTATANFSSDGCFFLQFLIRCLVWFLISDPMFVFSISDQMFVLIPSCTRLPNS